MPAIVVAAIVAAAATTTASVYASKKSSATSQAASQSEQSAIDKQLAYEREKEAERKAEQARHDTEAKAQWEAEQARIDEDRQKEQTRYNTTQQRYNDEIARQTKLDEATLADRRAQFAFAQQQYGDRQAQMAPYRKAGAGALSQLATLAGVSTPDAAPAPLLAEMPADWKPGDPVVATAPARDPARPSLLDDERLLPSRAGETAVTPVPVSARVMPTLTPTPLSGVAPLSSATMSEPAYQPLAASRASMPAAFTPAQVEALRKAAPLSALGRSRKARVRA